MEISLHFGGDKQSTNPWLQIDPLVMQFGPVAVEIWPFQISNTIATVLHPLILTGYLVLCIASFGLDHCLNPPRHALSQLLALLSWYLLPFLLNPLP